MEQKEQPLLQCLHVTKQKGEFVLSDINFVVEPGSIVGVIGRNGSGKSTLLRTLLGSYGLTSFDTNEVGTPSEGDRDETTGEIQLKGVSIKENTFLYKKKIAYILNDTPFPLWINAKDCGKVYGNYYKSFDQTKYHKLLKDFEVPIKISLKNLSKGQQIKQQLAFALSYEASLYILDEPTGNLDVEFREIFYKYVRGMVADNHKGVVYASHLVEELEQLADYILWIGVKEEQEVKRRGIQRFFGSIEDLRKLFQLIEADKEAVAEIPKELIVGVRERENHQEMLVKISREKLSEPLRSVSRYATLKEIMYYRERGEREHETDFLGTMD